MEDEQRVAERFLNEDLELHWQVDETKESFNRLLHHLEVKSNFKPYFEEALWHLKLDEDWFSDGLVVADLGAGVCWTSAILAKHPRVRITYAVDPSENRLKYARFVIKHFEVESKVKIIRGTFLEPNVSEKADLVLLCGSLHHCYDEQIEGLFSNIKQLLKPGGKVLIANEHYINWIWILKRLLSYLRHFSSRSELFYYPLRNLRAFHRFSGEHWRTRGELEKIFNDNGFTAQFFLHDGDLCKDKPTFYHRAGWRYYHAILRLSDVRES